MSEPSRLGLEDQPDWIQKNADTLFKGVPFDKLSKRKPLVTIMTDEKSRPPRSNLQKIIDAGKQK